MTRTNHALAVLPVGLLLAAATAGVVAQGSRTSDVGTVTVVAPRITYQVRRERGSVVPKEITVAQKSEQVSFADLDLTRTADLYALEDRIQQAASRVCADLAREFPEGEPGTDVCARRAADDAMAHLRELTRQQITTGR